MFTIDEDLTINITRGDAAAFALTATVDGSPYRFQPTDVVRLKVFAKKGCEDVVLSKDFLITEESESVEITLTRTDTKIGGIISKPKDYWYEIELNPEATPHTIIGYDEDGAKVFRLMPEGRDEIGEGDEEEAKTVYEQMLTLCADMVTKTDDAVSKSDTAVKMVEQLRKEADSGVFRGEAGQNGVSPTANGIFISAGNEDALLAYTDGTVTELGVAVKSKPGKVRINGIEKECANNTNYFSMPFGENMIYALVQRLVISTGEIEVLMWKCTETDGVLKRKSDGTDVPLRSTQYHELVFAIVRIPSGAEAITEDMIQDMRADPYYCGLITEKDIATDVPYAVRYDMEQSKTDAERRMAQYNVGIINSVSGILSKQDYENPYGIYVSGMNLYIKKGKALVEGVMYENRYEVGNGMSTSTSDQRRAYLIRLDRSTGKALLYLKVLRTGTDALITQSEGDTLPLRNDQYYDIVIGYIDIPANSTELTADMIHDLRDDPVYCGYVEYLVGGGSGGGSGGGETIETITIEKIGEQEETDPFVTKSYVDEAVEKAGGSGSAGSGDMQKSVYDPNNKAKDIFKYAEDISKLDVTNHALSDTAHTDIRELITGLTNRLNALADSDDTTLDQLSEIVAYIKSNKSLIDAITTEKVSVSDIINNLTTNNANRPLSAAQGVALKALIDGITIPKTLPNPNALTFTGAVTGRYDGSSPLTVNIPSGGTSGGTVGYPVVVMTASAAELTPNTYYKWGEAAALDITLAEPADTGVTNEYCFEFVSGETATTLSVPDTVKWVKEPNVEAGKTYQVSILNGVGVICGA